MSRRDELENTVQLSPKWAPPSPVQTSSSPPLTLTTLKVPKLESTVKSSPETINPQEEGEHVVQDVEMVQKPVGVVQQPADVVQQPVEMVPKPAEMVQQPAEMVQQPVEMVQQPVGILSSELPLIGPWPLSRLANMPSQKDNITEQLEVTLRQKCCKFLTYISHNLNLGREATSLACAYIHAYFTDVSFFHYADARKYDVVMAALHLAAKVAEDQHSAYSVFCEGWKLLCRDSAIPAKDSVIARDRCNVIIRTEFELLEVLGFRLEFKDCMLYMELVVSAFWPPDKLLRENQLVGKYIFFVCGHSTWSWVILFYHPAVIALACLKIAVGEIHDVKHKYPGISIELPKNWLERFETSITEETIDQIAAAILRVEGHTPCHLSHTYPSSIPAPSPTPYHMYSPKFTPMRSPPAMSPATQASVATPVGSRGSGKRGLESPQFRMEHHPSPVVIGGQKSARELLKAYKSRNNEFSSPHAPKVPPATGERSDVLCDLFIGNIHPDTKQQDIYKAFTGVEKVLSAKVFRDNNRVAKYAFVSFQDEETRRRALEHHKRENIKIKGKVCVVDLPRQPRERHERGDADRRRPPKRERSRERGEIDRKNVDRDRDWIQNRPRDRPQRERDRDHRERDRDHRDLRESDHRERERDEQDAFGIWVGEFPKHVDEQHLERIFADYGEVINTKIIFNRDHIPYGFVDFKTTAARDAALQAHVAVEGQALKIRRKNLHHGPHDGTQPAVRRPRQENPHVSFAIKIAGVPLNTLSVEKLIRLCIAFGPVTCVRIDLNKSNHEDDVACVHFRDQATQHLAMNDGIKINGRQARVTHYPCRAGPGHRWPVLLAPVPPSVNDVDIWSFLQTYYSNVVVTNIMFDEQYKPHCMVIFNEESNQKGMLTNCPTVKGHTIRSHYPRPRAIRVRRQKLGGDHRESSAGRRSRSKATGDAAGGVGEAKPGSAAAGQSKKYYSRDNAPFLQVEQLAPSVAEKDLKTAFDRFNLCYCQVVTDKNGISTRRGFLEFSDVESRDRALKQMNGVALKASKIMLKTTKPPSPWPPVAKASDGSGGRGGGRKRKLGGKDGGPDAKRAKVEHISKRLRRLYIVIDLPKDQSDFAIPEDEFFSKLLALLGPGLPISHPQYYGKFCFATFDTFLQAETAMGKLMGKEINGFPLKPRFLLQTKESRKTYVGVSAIYVAKLPPNATKDKIREKFGNYGKITSCKLFQKSHCAVVCYEETSAANQALCILNGIQFMGHKIQVTPKEGSNRKAPAKAPPATKQVSAPVPANGTATGAQAPSESQVVSTRGQVFQTFKNKKMKYAGRKKFNKKFRPLNTALQSMNLPQHLQQSMALPDLSQVLNPQQTLVNPQQTLVNPQQTLVNQQQTLVNPQQNLTQQLNTQQLMNPQQNMMTQQPLNQQQMGMQQMGMQLQHIQQMSQQLQFHPQYNLQRQSLMQQQNVILQRLRQAQLQAQLQQQAIQRQAQLQQLASQQNIMQPPPPPPQKIQLPPSTQLTGTNTQLTGTNVQLSGTNTQLTGTNAQLAGTNTQLTGTNIQLTGKNGQLTGQTTGTGTDNNLQASGTTIQLTGKCIPDANQQVNDQTSLTPLTALQQPRATEPALRNPGQAHNTQQQQQVQAHNAQQQVQTQQVQTQQSQTQLAKTQLAQIQQAQRKQAQHVQLQAQIQARQLQLHNYQLQQALMSQQTQVLPGNSVLPQPWMGPGGSQLAQPQFPMSPSIIGQTPDASLIGQTPASSLLGLGQGLQTQFSLPQVQQVQPGAVPQPPQPGAVPQPQQPTIHQPVTVSRPHTPASSDLVIDGHSAVSQQPATVSMTHLSTTASLPQIPAAT
eukprot:937110_1